MTQSPAARATTILNDGKGDDTYVFATGDGWDSLTDPDALGGRIIFGSDTLSGGNASAAGIGLWQSVDRKYNYLLSTEAGGYQGDDFLDGGVGDDTSANDWMSCSCCPIYTSRLPGARTRALSSSSYCKTRGSIAPCYPPSKPHCVVRKDQRTVIVSGG